ncbi:MAG: hypothetical protein Q9185_007174 [Variospora sp. 1 TL-2023]
MRRKVLTEDGKDIKDRIIFDNIKEFSTDDEQGHQTLQTIIHIPKMHYSTLLSIALTTFTLTHPILTHAIPNPAALAPAPISDLSARAPQEGSDPIPFDFADEDAPWLEDALGEFEAIPDSVLDDGDEALRQWALDYISASSPQPQTRSTAKLVERQDWMQIAKCALAIGKAIAENALPISKIRRIRELIKVLGGAKEVAKMLLKAKSIKQMIIIGGPELKEIAEILLGIADVVNDCFSF